MPGPIITLTTDFGTSDAFVAAMKGVVLGINPHASIVDLTHDVPRQDIRFGAYVFDSAYHYFPPGAIHVIVVDPTVGTSRRPIIVRTASATFVCPDNGLLSYVFTREGGRVTQGEAFTPTQASLPPGWTAYHLTNARYWRHPVSDTFHGRDIFAPAAAHLSLGEDPAAMGNAIETITIFPVPRPTVRDGNVVGCVQHVDRYGNLITNIEAALLPSGAGIVVEVAGRRMHRLARTYADVGVQRGELVALVGSHGCLEIAVAYGNAGETLGASVGAEVIVRPASLTDS